MVTILTEETVKQEIQQGVVAVDCFAPWCNPCKMLEPVMEELSQEPLKVKICKLNVEDTPDFSGEYSITSIPTVLFFKEGHLVNTASGVKCKEDYMKIIEEIS